MEQVTGRRMLATGTDYIVIVFVDGDYDYSDGLPDDDDDYIELEEFLELLDGEDFYDTLAEFISSESATLIIDIEGISLITESESVEESSESSSTSVNLHAVYLPIIILLLLIIIALYLYWKKKNM